MGEQVSVGKECQAEKKAALRSALSDYLWDSSAQRVIRQDGL
jgi:hypothetical protein